MLGNHDFYLFLDASLGSMGASHVMGSPVRDFAYAFTHPEEYLNWMPDHVRSDNETAAALGALFQALAWVYGRRGEAQVMLTPTPGKLDLFEAAPPFREDPGLAERTRARLREWQATPDACPRGSPAPACCPGSRSARWRPR
ncbi:unnamed protein product [Prorocentrum cordatum]|uniref:Uncharacterized protein n=1 Tax=Prorocentrum cordatum TaxID=2364126 RepID=A0ABN9SY30_9DINO|nr:unnamed protein product [Polarella glacialis]